jgi:hypothetical protein
MSKAKRTDKEVHLRKASDPYCQNALMPKDIFYDYPLAERARLVLRQFVSLTDSGKLPSTDILMYLAEAFREVLTNENANLKKALCLDKKRGRKGGTRGPSGEKTEDAGLTRIAMIYDYLVLRYVPEDAGRDFCRISVENASEDISERYGVSSKTVLREYNSWGKFCAINLSKEWGVPVECFLTKKDIK